MKEWPKKDQKDVNMLKENQSAKFSHDLSAILKLKREISSANNEHNDLQSKINGLIVDFNYQHTLAEKSGDEELKDILDEALAFLEDARDSLEEVSIAMRSAGELITCITNERTGIERRDKFASVEDLL